MEWDCGTDFQPLGPLQQIWEVYEVQDTTWMDEPNKIEKKYSREELKIKCYIWKSWNTSRYEASNTWTHQYFF